MVWAGITFNGVTNIVILIQKMTFDADFNNVILFRLPAHTSHLLQPLDVGVFKTTKGLWRSIIKNFFFKCIQVNRKSWIYTISIQLEAKNGFSSQNAHVGFEESGLYPLNREKISAEKIKIGAALAKSEEEPPSNQLAENQNMSFPRVRPCASKSVLDSPITPCRPVTLNNNKLKSNNDKILTTLENVLVTVTKKVGVDLTNSVLTMF